MFKNMQNMQAKIDEVTENLVKSIYDAKVKQLNMIKEWSHSKYINISDYYPSAV